MPTFKIRYRDVRYSKDPNNQDPAVRFITNSWLKSYEETVENKIQNRKEFFAEIVPKVQRLIRHCRTVVAIFDEEKSEEEFYLGWICGIKGRLHYVYVKSAYRRDGIATTLMDRVIGKTGDYSFPSKNYSFIKHIENKGFEFRELEENKDNGKRQRDSRYNGEVQCSCIGEGDSARKVFDE